MVRECPDTSGAGLVLRPMTSLSAPATKAIDRAPPFHHFQISNQPSSPTRRTIHRPASTHLEFLRKHPEVAAESVAWHIHDLTGDPGKKPAKIEYQYIPGAGR